MKILIVSNLFPPIVFGGYEILCRQVVEELKRRGHEVSVLTSDFMAESVSTVEGVSRTLKLTTNFPRPGESVGKVDFSLRGMHRVGSFNARMLEQTLSDFSPDLVFCWCLNRLGAGLVRRAEELGIPVYYTINDEHPRQFRYTESPKNLRQYARSLAERVLSDSTFLKVSRVRMTVISSALKRNLMALGAPVGDARVIYQGVDLKQFPFRATQRRSDEPLRILYVGQLSKVKGVHTLLKAVSKLRCDFRLTVVGAGVPEYEAGLREIVRGHGLEGKVFFLGKLSRPEVVQQYQQNHVLVFSSEWEEPFGLTHLEAMASGCAVVSTTTGGSAELVAHGHNALAYEAGSVDELASRLATLEKDEALRQRLLHGARGYVEKHHCLQGYVSELEEWLTAAG